MSSSLQNIIPNLTIFFPQVKYKKKKNNLEFNFYLFRKIAQCATSRIHTIGSFCLEHFCGINSKSPGPDNQFFLLKNSFWLSTPYGTSTVIQQNFTHLSCNFVCTNSRFFQKVFSLTLERSKLKQGNFFLPNFVDNVK